MDEVPITYDMCPSRIVDFKGIRHPVVKSTGSDRRRCTVVLGCFADGRQLSPIIFKGINEKHQSITSIHRHRSTIIKVQPRAWMTYY